MTEDPYRLLGVDADATEDEIRAAFRRAVKRDHPDLGSADAAGDVGAVIDAYRRISQRSESPGPAGAPVEVRTGGTAETAPTPAPVRCPDCEGRGRVPVVGPCRRCGGTGGTTRLDLAPARVVRCRSCGGAGAVSGTSPCPGCGGTGAVPKR